MAKQQVIVTCQVLDIVQIKGKYNKKWKSVTSYKLDNTTVEFSVYEVVDYKFNDQFDCQTNIHSSWQRNNAAKSVKYRKETVRLYSYAEWFDTHYKFMKLNSQFTWIKWYLEIKNKRWSFVTLINVSAIDYPNTQLHNTRE